MCIRDSLEVDLGVIVGSYWTHLLSLSQGVLHLQISFSHWLAMGLTTFHNLNVNANGMWTLGQGNWHRFPSQICLSDAYLGRISTDPPPSLIFHNFYCKCIVVPYFYVNDSQLGSEIHFFNLGWNLVNLEVGCLSFEAFIVKSVIFMIFHQSVQHMF